MNESKLNEQALLYPMLFEPNLHTVVWGGSQLRPYKGMAPSDEPIGESWEVSAVPTSMSVVSNARVYPGQGGEPEISQPTAPAGEVYRCQEGLEYPSASQR